MGSFNKEKNDIKAFEETFSATFLFQISKKTRNEKE